MRRADFGNFAVGRVITSARVTVTESHIVQWAGLTGDWNPIHLDDEWARTSTFGRRIAHGPLTFGLAVGLVAQTGEFGDAVIAWLGTKDMRAVAPVLVGDTIGVTATVTAARPASGGSRGVVTLRYVVSTSAAVEVLIFDSSLLMRSSVAQNA